MMRENIYLETTVPSFYFENRVEPEMVSRRNWTREWWEKYHFVYDIFISDAVIAELEEGNYPNKIEVLEFVKDLPVLEINHEIENIADVYMKNYVMPKEDVGDALHLAIAAFYKCDFLLTWNCRHLANAHKTRHIKRINEKLDLFTPLIVTPLELLPEEDEYEER